MKTLYFDLETTPILGYVWRAYEDNLLSIEQDTTLLAVGWSINGKTINVASTRQYKEAELVKLLWKLMDDADVIVAQNGDRFDIKVANTFFQKYKLPPPSPYKTVDTLKLAKKYFRFTKNKLDHLASVLLGEEKMKTDYELWKECMAGNAIALRRMERYCKHDVRLLIGVYEKLKPWHTGHPNHNLYEGTTHKCPVCGGNTQKRGYMYTRTGKYQRYQCTTCGAWSKGEKIKHDKVIS
jgi:predicted RNA-binding Zn-ribbon protein involved in translation (DUF1610 family)